MEDGGWDLSQAATELIKSSLVRFPTGDVEEADQVQNAVDYAAYLGSNHNFDMDLLSMYAEAEMDVMAVRGQGYYTLNGEVNPGEPREEAVRAMDALETVMSSSGASSQQPLALHMYIHITEPLTPGEGAAKGEASADSLASLNVTGSGHLLHMPGHLFMRVGRYADVALSNTLAHEADDLYEGKGMLPYGPAHNSYMGVAAAALDGQSVWSIKYSEIMRDIYRGGDEDDSPGVEDGWNTLLMVYLRFGMWEEVVKDKYWRVPKEFGLEEGNN
jgi:hypothetical protein